MQQPLEELKPDQAEVSSILSSAYRQKMGCIPHDCLGSVWLRQVDNIRMKQEEIYLIMFCHAQRICFFESN